MKVYSHFNIHFRMNGLYGTTTPCTVKPAIDQNDFLFCNYVNTVSVDGGIPPAEPLCSAGGEPSLLAELNDYC